MGKIFKSLRQKVITIIIVSFFAVTLPSILLLFERMNLIVYEKVKETEETSVRAKMETMDSYLEHLLSMVSTISESQEIRNVLDLNDRNERLLLVEASSLLNAYGSSSIITDYINKIVVFRRDGISFEYANKVTGYIDDVELIKGTDQFKNLKFAPGSRAKILFGHEINDPSRPAIIAYAYIPESESYVYIELRTTIFDDVFEGVDFENFYIETPSWCYPGDPEGKLQDTFNYKISRFRSQYVDMEVLLTLEKRPIALSGFYGVSTLLLIVAGAVLLATVLSLFLSEKITKPVVRLHSHILHLIVTNDFGVQDEEIEKGDDEIATIGKAINEMSLSIRNLLENNERISKEKRDAEIAMLTMQINPHFLYNTLESIRYMAEIQRNRGIGEMSRGLVSLLKNMVKGNGDHIPLSEEIKLLEAYNAIQQVRYMGMYDVRYDIPEPLLRYRIVKFTLQPLLENAIFHGIEPKGECGTVTVSARRDDRYLYVTVEDDGIGMTPEELAQVFAERKHEKTDLTGVGVKNVDTRLKLTYGIECGLSYASEQGKGTVVTVKLALED